MTKYRRFLLPALALLLVLSLWQGGAALKARFDRQALQRALDDALTAADPALAQVDFSVPYDSCRFTPRNIPRGGMQPADCAAARALLDSLTFAAPAPAGAGENIVIRLPAEDGALHIALSDAETCTVTLTPAEGTPRAAAYTYDPAARDALLARGDLPTIEEMKAAIQQGLQAQLENLGDSAQEGTALR